MLAAHLLCLVCAMAPVLPHMAEDAWQHLPFNYILKNGLRCEYVFEAGWPSVDANWNTLPESDVEYWKILLQVSFSFSVVLCMCGFASH